MEKTVKSVEQSVVCNAFWEQTPDSMWATDLTGILLRVSMKKAENHGFVDPEEMIGKMFDDERFMKPDEAEQVRKYMTEMIITGKKIADKIQRLERDGRIIYYSVSMFPIFGENKEIVGFAGTSRDITSRIAIEELVKTDVHSILHELNNILVGHGGFMGYMASLLKKGKVEKCLSLLPARIDECFIYRETVAMFNLRISQLGLEKPELPETETIFDLHEVFNRLMKRHEPRMQELNIRWDNFMGLIPENKYILKTVYERLIYALDAVFSNQIKYGEIITRLTFGAEIDQQQRQLVLNVSSDGIHINEEFAKTKLFKKGQRAKDTSHKEGTGFGLYTAREYIRSLGGEMEYVEVIADDWMGFIIILPLSVLQNN